jgi:hypothetical protein
MALKLKSPETQQSPDPLREPKTHKEIRKIRKKVGSAPAKKPDFDEEAMILRENKRLAESETPLDDLNFETPLPEIAALPERLLSIESNPKIPFPAEIAKIIGKHGTFWKSMEDEKAFGAFMKTLPKLKKTVSQDLLAEMLVISAEQSSETAAFIQHDAHTRKPHSSWKETVEDPAAFADLMQGGWLTHIVRFVEPKEAVAEILIVAAKTSKTNSQMILDKANRDAAGGPILENTEYNLSKLLGKETYDQVIAAALEKLGLGKKGR